VFLENLTNRIISLEEMKMQERTVSVVITTCKREFAILERAIKSVLNQTYKPSQIIVVNDTPDGNRVYNEVSEKIRKYSDKVTYIADGVNRGACAARNIGLNMAGGEFVAFLDDDDEWLPNKLELQIEQMKEDVIFVTCRTMRKVELSDGKYRLGRKSIRLPRNITKKWMYEYNCGSSCSCPLIKTGILKEIGGFCEQLPALQDYECWLRLIENGRFRMINIPLVYLYFHKGDRISKNNMGRVKGFEYLIKNYSESAPDKNSFVCICYISILIEYFNNDDKLKFEKQLKVVSENYVFSLINNILMVRLYLSIFRKWIKSKLCWL
jgi:glycosyltransferase involved in cell wall biosynthesis